MPSLCTRSAIGLNCLGKKFQGFMPSENDKGVVKVITLMRTLKIISSQAVLQEGALMAKEELMKRYGNGQEKPTSSRA